MCMGGLLYILIVCVSVCPSAIVNPQRACMRVTVVVLSVCVSVKSHLASGASVFPENALTYSAGNED